MCDKDILQEIEYYNALPCVFEEFIELSELSDGVIHLVCKEKTPAIPEKGWVPMYAFDICVGAEKVGAIRLRVGYSDSLYYAGQIGYDVDEAHRGKGYALWACRLIAPVARAHGMAKLLITTEESNTASKRVCEKLGARLVRTTPTPSWHDCYDDGWRLTSIYEWDLTK
ncbi:MAG: GNAT family N-acetyltransferase [Defluviitaleaceae bacterium]|nr:GNAT family N-acetyltransferase [Defluviitaleaceae bacterium]